VLHPLVQPGGRIFGIDVDEEAVESGNVYNWNHGFHGVELLATDLLGAEQRFERDSFDVIAGMQSLYWIRYPERVRETLAVAYRLLRPGGTIVDIEADYPCFLSGQWKDPEVEEAQWEWMNGKAAGYERFEGFNFRIGPDLPILFLDAGFRDLRVLTYTHPEWFPPFEPWQIEAIEQYVRDLTPGQPEFSYAHSLLETAQFTDGRIEELARIQRGWFEKQVAVMKRGEMPTMSHEVMIAAAGRKPFASPPTRGREEVR
jgi:SAM-dependent methyltransferase